VLPDEEFRPNKIDMNHLQTFDESLSIPLKVIGCNLTSDEIVKEWEALCNDGFPLIYIKIISGFRGN
jgi:hypothetical protein